MAHSVGTNPIKRRNPSYFYSIMSVALVLFLLGFFLLFLMHAPKWVNDYKETVNVLVELNDDVPIGILEKFSNTLENESYIKEGSLKFNTKDQVAEEMRESLGSDENSIDIANPFNDVFIFNLKADYLNSENLEEMRTSILQNDFVKDVFFQKTVIDQVNSNLRKIGFAALGLGLLFVIIALVLIHNTIRLVMYSNRFLIKNMQLVGASWRFISRPYLNKGIVNGLLSAFIAIFLLIGIVLLINVQFPGLRLEMWLEDYWSLLIVLSGIIILGVIITFGSTYVVVNKYLKMRLDDLY